MIITKNNLLKNNPKSINVSIFIMIFIIVGVFGVCKNCSKNYKIDITKHILQKYKNSLKEDIDDDSIKCIFSNKKIYKKTDTQINEIKIKQNDNVNQQIFNTKLQPDTIHKKKISKYNDNINKNNEPIKNQLTQLNKNIKLLKEMSK